MNKISKEIIKEKSKFIMDNSGFICFQLEVDKISTINNLSLILLDELSLNEEQNKITALELTDFHNKFKDQNSYEKSIYIIFEICKYINEVINNDNQKLKLLNILRLYPKYFKNNNYNLIKNKWIIVDKNQYQKIKEKMI